MKFLGLLQVRHVPLRGESEKRYQRHAFCYELSGHRLSAPKSPASKLGKADLAELLLSCFYKAKSTQSGQSKISATDVVRPKLTDTHLRLGHKELISCVTGEELASSGQPRRSPSKRHTAAGMQLSVLKPLALPDRTVFTRGVNIILV